MTPKVKLAPIHEDVTVTSQLLRLMVSFRWRPLADDDFIDDISQWLQEPPRSATSTSSNPDANFPPNFILIGRTIILLISFCCSLIICINSKIIVSLFNKRNFGPSHVVIERCRLCEIPTDFTRWRQTRPFSISEFVNWPSTQDNLAQSVPNRRFLEYKSRNSFRQNPPIQFNSSASV